MGDRTCTSCMETKLLSEFYCTDRERSIYRRVCKPCYIERLTDSEAYKRAQAKRVRHRHERVCDYCGSAWETANASGRYCSASCFGSSRRKSTAVVLFSGVVSRRCDLPDRHPARQSVPRPRLFVEGPCSWCGERFTIADQTQALYCSRLCAKNAGRAARGRFAVPPHVRQSIYERDGWICQLCEDPVDPDLGPSAVWGATLDHIVCQSWGEEPDHSPKNLRLAHRWCNSVRGDESHYGPEVLARGQLAA